MTAPSWRPLVARLPDDFEFGVATSAAQIEGSTDVDGRGRSIWDVFAAQPGATRGGDTPEVACDHYVRFPEDVRLIAELGVDRYRFSIAWPRIQPTGTGSPSQRGLDFYDRLVDELLAASVTPDVTLFHWDLPQALEDLGGWPERDTAYRFAEYAGHVMDRLGDRVHRWMTMNEPLSAAGAGYGDLGQHAPGRRLGHGALAAVHHMLLGHGLAVDSLRSRSARDEIGIVLNPPPVRPLTDSDDDRQAADRLHTSSVLLYTEPLLRGSYGQAVTDLYAPISDFSFVRDGDLPLISSPADFLGVNYYFPWTVTAAPMAPPESRVMNDVGARIVDTPGSENTSIGWAIKPQAFTELLTWLDEEYRGVLPPVVITENGSAWDFDVVDERGRCDDPRRIDYLASHLDAVCDAIDVGVDVRGYYAWSLMDNFEWADGYAPRFGLVHVDYATQRRTPKMSYGWLQALLLERRSAAS
ncbi:MAG: GH1 family beta-glucosidase [Aeromicrobium sp.]